MRILKWTPYFCTSEDPSIVLLWVMFEGLPLHFFNKIMLFALVSAVGKALMIDDAIATLTRPSLAMVGVEVDVSKTD
jgi:hypothetical protein